MTAHHYRILDPADMTGINCPAWHHDVCLVTSKRLSSFPMHPNVTLGLGSLLWVGVALADDTATLQALLNGPSNVIQLSAGTYRVDQVSIPAGKTLIGATPRSRILHSTSNTPMFTMGSGSAIRDLDISGFWATNNLLAEVAIKANSVTGIVLSGLDIDHVQFGIETDHTGENLFPPTPVGAGLRIEHCVFHDVSRGANIINSRSILCNSNLVYNVLEHGLQFWGYWDVTPLVRYCSDITFIGNVVSNVAGGAGIWGSAGDRILMQSNRVVWVGDMCLDLELCADSEIRDNYAEGAYYGGIGVYFTASNIVVSNNLVLNNRYAPADGNGWWVRAGIWLNDANFKQYVAIIGNTVSNSPDLVRRSIWVSSTNINHITARYNRIIGASHWWGDNTIAYTNFSIIDGVLTGMTSPPTPTVLYSSLMPQTGCRYFPGRTNSPSVSNLWTQAVYDDSGWVRGDMPFWYGDPGTGVELTDMFTNYTTLYLRQPFTVGSTQGMTSLVLRVDYDDAVVVWLNGGMAWASSNAPATLTHTSTATAAHNWSGDTPGFAQPVESVVIPVGQLVIGTNWMAALGVNAGLSSSDFHLDLTVNAALESSDMDQDGMPDAWEALWTGTTGLTSAGSDRDGDGLVDEDEYLAGTDPTKSTSCLGVTTSRWDATGGVVVFAWPSQPGRAYRLRSTPLMQAPWTTITGVITATPPLNVYTAAVSSSAVFYRLRLE